jgi:phosphoglucosamine mutase
MSDRLFGTDGVRGLANGILTAELATSLGIAAAEVLAERGELKAQKIGRPIAIVGRDPRISGEFLQAAVSAGLASAGVDVIDIGIVPTPAVAYLTELTNAELGVMLSASHNAMPDNGIKFFSRGGHKLADEVEDAIERHLHVHTNLPTGGSVGRIQQDHKLVEKYLTHLLTTIDNSLTGIKVVVDGANGSASIIGPEVLRRAGAEVITIHCEPDGLNINENCGSTHMSDLFAAVIEHSADIGIAHDGDADRCLVVAQDGAFVDGDQILAILANGRKEKNILVGNTVVATVMSNLGFSIAMKNLNINVVATAVGDRYVLEAMREKGFTIGGEQSGHVVLSEFSTTGDGILTALHLLDEMKRTGKSIGELANLVTRLPQILVNVKGVDKLKVENSVLVSAINKAQEELGETGRVLLRPSGTESLIRVMVEAVTQEQAENVANQLAVVVQETCSL